MILPEPKRRRLTASAISDPRRMSEHDVLRRSPAPTSRSARRTLGVSGVAGALLLIGAFGGLGDAPDPHDSSAAMADYFIAHRAAVQVSVALGTAAAVALIVFFCALREQLIELERTVAANVAAVAGLAVVALLTLNEVLYGVLSWQLASADPRAVQPVFLLTIVSPVVQGPLLAATMAATAVAARPGSGMPPWYRISSVVAAGIAAVAGMSFAQHGYFYPDVQQQVVGQLFVLWVLVTAVVCTIGRVRSAAIAQGSREEVPTSFAHTPTP